MILASRLQPLPVPALASLPLTGEAHPLRRRRIRMLYHAFAAATLIHLAAFSAFLARRAREPVSLSSRVIRIDPLRLTQPPSIRGAESAPVDVGVRIRAQVGVPLPVPDVSAPLIELPTNREMIERLTDFPAVDLGRRPGDSLVIEIPAAAQHHPAPAEFDAVEEKPALISFPPPPYPSLARQAEVEGTVLLRVLVGTDGRVHEVAVTDGIEMLNEVSIEAARQALFKPALQQHRPVPVWVEIPLTFRLHD